MLKKIMEDKRILSLYILVIVSLIVGVTYAMGSASLAINVGTALISVDEDAYGSTTFNSDDIDFRPIIDTNVETSLNNVVKVDFVVGGASTNNNDNIIYDIALVDLALDCDLVSQYIKWKLVKDGVELSNGSLNKGIKNKRLVLTENQEDLPIYSANKTGYHNYTFYMWFSDSCQSSSITSCIGKVDQSNLLGKYFSGKVEVELYTESKSGYGAIDDRDTSDSSACISTFLLNNVSVGSYVSYTGNNGCIGEACNGQNANYVDDTNMGYCHSSNYKFNVNGWRIAYIERKNVHLVSAGATDCMCTSSDGKASSSSCPSYLGIDDFYKHINNLNNMALKYCNKNYVDGGVCNNTVVWAMDDLDFRKIVGSEIESTCFGNSSVMCGRYNSLIDNGGYYYFAKQYSGSTTATSLLWNPSSPAVLHSYGSSGYLAGVRPVIKLDSSVIVIGGTGTYENPYIIANS